MRPFQYVLAAVISMSSTMTPVLAGPFEDAIAAYNRHDYASALQLLRPLAESGNVRAQALLGFMYNSGIGVLPDDIEAAKWYGRAADTGDDIAQYHIGIMHLNGQGVPRDLVRAYMWLELAAMRGHRGAAMDRDRIAESLTAAQIAEAQKLAREWKPTAGLLGPRPFGQIR
jgi:TPR repeat protein